MTNSKMTTQQAFAGIQRIKANLKKDLRDKEQAQIAKNIQDTAQFFSDNAQWYTNVR